MRRIVDRVAIKAQRRSHRPLQVVSRTQPCAFVSPPAGIGRPNIICRERRRQGRDSVLYSTFTDRGKRKRISRRFFRRGAIDPAAPFGKI